MSLPTRSVMAESITTLMDQLPIMATQLGYRGESHELGASTPEETALADALFKVSETWAEVRPS